MIGNDKSNYGRIKTYIIQNEKEGLCSHIEQDFKKRDDCVPYIVFIEEHESNFESKLKALAAKMNYSFYYILED